MTSKTAGGLEDSGWGLFAPCTSGVPDACPCGHDGAQAPAQGMSSTAQEWCGRGSPREEWGRKWRAPVATTANLPHHGVDRGGQNIPGHLLGQFSRWHLAACVTCTRGKTGVCAHVCTPCARVYVQCVHTTRPSVHMQLPMGALPKMFMWPPVVQKVRKKLYSD